MKKTLKYLIPLLILVLVLIFNKRPLEKLTDIKTKKLPPINREPTETAEPKIDKKSNRKIIYLTPPTKKRTTFINKKNDKWMDFLEENLLRFQDPTIKLKITHIEGVIFYQNEKSRLAEKVLVSFLNPNGLVSSFNAYVDPENGHIIGVPWNKTVVENKNFPNFSPSGVIMRIKKEKPVIK
jgi:hypothetical protein